MKLKYVPMNDCYLLAIGSWTSVTLGLLFMILDFIDYQTARTQEAMSGGLILLFLGIVGTIYSVRIGIELEVSSSHLKTLRKFLSFKFEKIIPLNEVESVEWSSYRGTINILSKNKVLEKIPATIVRSEGELADQKNHPEIPGGGPKREMFNLKYAIEVQVRSFSKS